MEGLFVLESTVEDQVDPKLERHMTRFAGVKPAASCLSAAPSVGGLAHGSIPCIGPMPEDLSVSRLVLWPSVSSEKEARKATTHRSYRPSGPIF